jgi:hypothetical protein
MLPRISVVTCSYNQGKFIGRTIESVLAQNYPRLEHIVVDGMSTDETPAVLAGYPHLRVVREPDSGQAEAINKGFRLATGDIFCFLNSDDTFFPGALHRVAREVDPSRGRHVVMGRCSFIDEDDRATGVEHPSAFRGHVGVLEVWKINCIPQPATFWAREVWEKCGPLDEAEHLVLDFDLMCRISRRYRFHHVDQVLAGYRLHTSSKTCSNTADQIYEAAIRVSRRHWGGPWAPRFWRLLCSLALHRLEQRTGRTRHAADWAIKGEQAWARGQKLRALARMARSALLAPGAAVRRSFLLNVGPRLAALWPGVPTPVHTWQSRRLPGHTTAWRTFTGAHGDGCVGPHYAATVELTPASRSVHVDGFPVVPWLRAPLVLEVALDGRTLVRHRWTYGQPFSLAVPVAGLAPGPHRLEITSSAFVLPSEILGGADHRPLVFRLNGLRVKEEDVEVPARAEAACAEAIPLPACVGLARFFTRAPGLQRLRPAAWRRRADAREGGGS